MQAVKGLNKACGVILHSDQGWQYQMVAYRRILAEHGIIQSYVEKRELLGQRCDGKFLWAIKNGMFLWSGI